MILTEQDRSRLHEAAALIGDVMDAHSHNVITLGDLPLPVASMLCEAIRETRIAERFMEAS